MVSSLQNVAYTVFEIYATLGLAIVIIVHLCIFAVNALTLSQLSNKHFSNNDVHKGLNRYHAPIFPPYIKS